MRKRDTFTTKVLNGFLYVNFSMLSLIEDDQNAATKSRFYVLHNYGEKTGMELTFKM